jgi:hypothetical protein
MKIIKNILHSGDFLDYDGNTIRVTFETRKEINSYITIDGISKNTIAAPAKGGTYMVQFWVNDETYLTNYQKIIVGITYQDFTNNERFVTLTQLSDIIAEDGYPHKRYELKVDAISSPQSIIRTGKVKLIVGERESPNPSIPPTPLPDIDSQIITITQIHNPFA